MVLFGVLIQFLVQMHQKHLGHKYLSDLQINLFCLLKVRIKIILNNNIELKMKYLEGRSVFMENFMNGHFKSERTKIVLCFFLTKVNIWKFRKIKQMHFSPEFLITVIQVSSLINLILTLFTLSIVVQLTSLIMYPNIFFLLYIQFCCLQQI